MNKLKNEIPPSKRKQRFFTGWCVASVRNGYFLVGDQLQIGPEIAFITRIDHHSDGENVTLFYKVWAE